MRTKLLLSLGLLATAHARAGIILAVPMSPNVIESSGSGFASLTIADNQLSVFLSITFSGLFGTAIGAGYNSSLLFPLVGVPAAQSGSASGTFAITPADVAGLQADGYFYVDTTDATREIGGEVPEDLVPEPPSVVLGFLGLGALLLAHRIRAT